MTAIFILTLCFGYRRSLLHTFFSPYLLPYVKIQTCTHKNNNNNKKKKQRLSDDDANSKSINEENLSKFYNSKNSKNLNSIDLGTPGSLCLQITNNRTQWVMMEN